MVGNTKGAVSGVPDGLVRRFLVWLRLVLTARLPPHLGLVVKLVAHPVHATAQRGDRGGFPCVEQVPTDHVGDLAQFRRDLAEHVARPGKLRAAAHGLACQAAESAGRGGGAENERQPHLAAPTQQVTCPHRECYLRLILHELPPPQIAVYDDAAGLRGDASALVRRALPGDSAFKQARPGDFP